MEYSVKSIALSLVIVTVVTCAWRLLNWLWLRPKKLEKILRQQGLKGTPYRLLHGDLKESSEMLKEAKARPLSFEDDIILRINPFLHKLVKDYGKNSFSWFGPTPRVNITNPDHVKEVFTRINDFHKLNVNPLTLRLVSGVTTYSGEKWEKHRRIITPAFHQEKLKLMSPAIYQSCSELITKWEKLVSAGEGSCELDVWPSLCALTSEIMSRTAFGSNYEEGRTIFQLQQQLMDMAMEVYRSLYIPGSSFLPTKRNKTIKELDKGIRASLMGIIRKREKAMRDGEGGKDDLLGILMETNSREIEEHGNNKSVGMSLHDVIEECKLFYVVGQETTSILINWTMVLLSKHQAWQERARQEVLQVFGANKPDYDGLTHLKIVQMIFYEVLRVYPSGPLYNRLVPKETKLGNLTLPAGVQVSLPAILIHHDPELWGDDALEFNPERFAEGISKATKNRACFMPFALGPRICLGQNFALVQAKMAMAMILQNFSFELSPSYVHAPAIPGLSLHSEFGTHLILRKI